MTQGSIVFSSGPGHSNTPRPASILDLSGNGNHLTITSSVPATNGFYGEPMPFRHIGGYAYNFRRNSNTNAVPEAYLNTIPSQLKPSMVSIFWAGQITADPGPSNYGCPIAMVTYDTNATDSPYQSYGFARAPSSAATPDVVGFINSIGGANSVSLSGVTAGTPTKYGRYLSLGQSLKSGSNLGYVNGSLAKVDASHTGSIQYTSSSRLILNGGGDYSAGNWGDAFTNIYALYIWNRILLPEEFAMLHADPLAPLTRRDRPLYFLLSSPNQNLGPSGLASGFAAGDPTLEYNQNLSPAGLASGFAAGSPIVVNGISPVGKPSDFAVGTPTVSLRSIGPTGKPSDFAAGTPTLDLIQTLLPTGKPSDFAAGLPSLIPAQIISPAGKASDFAAGTPIVAGGPQVIQPGGLRSAFAAGLPTVSGGSSGFRIWIGGVDFSQYLMNLGVANPGPDAQTTAQPFQMTSQTIGRWTVIFDLYDPTLEAYPGIDDTVLVQDETGRVLFSGGLITVDVDRFDSPSVYQSYHCTAQDWSAICDRRTVNATYLAGDDVSAVFADIWAQVLQNPPEGIAATGIAPTGTDTLDGNEVFSFVTVTQAFDQICTDQGWVWWIDEYAVLHAVPNPDLPPCPFSITESTKNFRALSAQATLVDYRNVQYVVSNVTAVPGVAVQKSGGLSPGDPGYGGPTVTETYTLPQAKATEQGLELGVIIPNFAILQVTSLTVNGVAQPVQLGNQALNFQKSWAYFPGFQYLYAPYAGNNSPALPYPATTSPYPNSGDVVVLTYIAIQTAQSAVVVSGTPLMPGTPGSAGTWGSGVFENVQQVKNLNLQSDLNAVAQALLTRSSDVPTLVQFETDVPGAIVGQALTINLPLSFLPPTDQFIITYIQGTRSTGVLEYGSSIRWIIQAMTGQDIGNAIKWFERFVQRTENPLPIQQFSEQNWVISPGQSVTSASAPQNPIVLTSGGNLVQAYAIAGTAPTNQALVIDIQDGGVSIFPPGGQLVIPAGSLDPVYVNKFALPTVAIGDQLQVVISYQVGSGAALPAASVTVSLRWSTPGLPAGQTEPGVYAEYISGSVFVTTTSLPSGTHGSAYAQVQLTAAGGTPPYTWAATGLPAGMACSSAGIISGTPTSAGTYGVSFTATDSSSPALAAVGSAQLVIA
jgi:hypothetical protein